MGKVDKRQRQKARRAAAEAAKRRAALRRRRVNAGIILAAACLGIALLVVIMFVRSQSGKSSASPSASASPTPAMRDPGPGLSCATPATTPAHTYPGFGPMKIDYANKKYQAVMVTNFGTINIDLYSTDAPETVNNFASLACDGYYNNSKFHRIANTSPLFVIQGGDPLHGDGTGDPGYTIPDELDRAKQDGYKRGTVAMANRGPDSGGSQFFIVVKDSVLQPNYAVFGQVTSGMDAVEKIFALGPTSAEEPKPTQDAVISSVTIVEQKPGEGGGPAGAPAG